MQLYNIASLVVTGTAWLLSLCYCTTQLVWLCHWYSRDSQLMLLYNTACQVLSLVQQRYSAYATVQHNLSGYIIGTAEILSCYCTTQPWVQQRFSAACTTHFAQLHHWWTKLQQLTELTVVQIFRINMVDYTVQIIHSLNGDSEDLLTHCIQNRLSHTIYWKCPISILGMSGYEIYIFLEKNG